MSPPASKSTQPILVGGVATGLQARDLDAIVHCIAVNLGPGQAVDIWLFGSRARGQQRRHSDVDLLLCQRAGQRLTSRQIGAMTDALEDSALPFHCDLVRDNVLLSAYREQVEAERVLLIENLVGPEDSPQ